MDYAEESGRGCDGCVPFVKRALVGIERSWACVCGEQTEDPGAGEVGESVVGATDCPDLESTPRSA